MGGPDLKIVVYSRESSSGTYAFFRDTVLDGREYTGPLCSLRQSCFCLHEASSKRNLQIQRGADNCPMACD